MNPTRRLFLKHFPLLAMRGSFLAATEMQLAPIYLERGTMSEKQKRNAGTEITFSGRGIRVNAVAPGLVKSEMTRKLWETESAATASQQMHALGRLGEPDDIAKAIAWLLDAENYWITGQTIAVDGGLSTVVPRTKI